MKNTIYILLLFLFSGCHFLDDYSQDLVVAKTVTDLDEILLGSGYLPSMELEEITDGPVCWWLHVLDDDVNTVIEKSATKGRSTMDRAIYGYTTWQREVGRNYNGNVLSDDAASWNRIYQHINAVNIILTEIDDKEHSSSEDNQKALRIKGECHFLRAQFYFFLVNLYADAYQPGNASEKPGVPLKLTHYIEHDKNKESQFQRASVGSVYQQIVKDLEASIEYFTESPQTRSFYRASKEAALLLLSRVYLYMQEWEKAKQTTKNFLDIKSELQDLSVLTTQTDQASLNEENPEIIFSQGSLNLQNAFSGQGGDLCISGNLYYTYAATDYRKQIWFSPSANSDSIGLSRKYKTGTHQSYISDIFMLRSAEAYLNMAEAYAMTDKAGEASTWLNKLRHYRIKDYQEEQHDAQTVIKQVRLERRKELCLEGHRWFDLRRYAVCEKAPFSKTIERTYALYNYDYKNLFLSAEVYRLEEGDPAYTFSIPKSVLEFDMGMPDNIRPTRKYVHTITVDFNNN